MSRITIKEIAQHFNISPSTVSRALNNHSSISQETKDQIKQYALDCGYVPNMFGRGLKGIKNQVIGVILPNSTNPNFYSQLDAIEREANREGYHILLCFSHEDWKREQEQLNLMIQKNVDGVILTPTNSGNNFPLDSGRAALKRAQIPLVLLSRSDPQYQTDLVKFDNTYSAYIATKHLIKNNHKHIIHITSSTKSSSVKERIIGYQSALLDHGIDFNEKDIYYCDVSDETSIVGCVEKILKGKSDFSAIFAYNDHLAMIIIQTLLKNGISVPNDISIMGTDNMVFSRLSAIPLTTVSVDNYQLGKTAVSVLLNRIKGDFDTPKEVYILSPSGIVERKSVARKEYVV